MTERRYLLIALFADITSARFERALAAFAPIIADQFKGKSMLVHKTHGVLILALKSTMSAYSIHDTFNSRKGPLESGDKMLVIEAGDSPAISGMLGVHGFLTVPGEVPPAT